MDDPLGADGAKDEHRVGLHLARRLEIRRRRRPGRPHGVDDPHHPPTQIETRILAGAFELGAEAVGVDGHGGNPMARRLLYTCTGGSRWSQCVQFHG